MPNKQGTNYTRQELINIQNMNRFLNPPKTGSYAVDQKIRKDRAVMWANFVKNNS